MYINRLCRRFVLFVSVMAAAAWFLPGCGSPTDKDGTDGYIVKSGEIVVSSSQFREELELKKTAYPYNIKSEAYHYNNMVIQLTQDLAEEVVLIREAREKGIEISQQEMEKAENDFKESYPDNVFEEMLLENAIDYSLWKERFRRKLLIDRLIQQELKEKIEITPDEVAAFYDRNKGKIQKDNMKETDFVAQFKAEKAEEIYHDWIDELRQKYSVSINDKALKAFLVRFDQEKG